MRRKGLGRCRSRGELFEALVSVSVQGAQDVLEMLPREPQTSSRCALVPVDGAEGFLDDATSQPRFQLREANLASNLIKFSQEMRVRLGNMIRGAQCHLHPPSARTAFSTRSVWRYEIWLIF